jgi:hypothetical protein
MERIVLTAVLLIQYVALASRTRVDEKELKKVINLLDSKWKWL